MNCKFRTYLKIPVWLLLNIIVSLSVLTGCSYSDDYIVNTLDSILYEQDSIDTNISYNILRELIQQDGLDSININVKTYEGVVLLSGTVDNLLTKDFSIKLAKNVKDVRAVVDRISVKKSEKPDFQIKSQIENVLIINPATDKYEIKVTVNDGEVDLSGKVDSWQEKMLASKVVMGIEGVRKIENNIYFDYVKNRPDYEIKEDVEQALKWDVKVDHESIKVKVNDGIVYISGFVDNDSEKSQAEINGWVAGVKKVNVSNLKTSVYVTEDVFKKDMISVDDQEIRKAIKDAFFYDPRVSSFNPEIKINDGLVILSGYVYSLKEKIAAEIDARNTVGVWRVVNQLDVSG